MNIERLAQVQGINKGEKAMTLTSAIKKLEWFQYIGEGWYFESNHTYEYYMKAAKTGVHVTTTLVETGESSEEFMTFEQFAQFNAR